MSMATIIDGKITLYSFIDRDTRERVSKCAELPKAAQKDWEGESLHVLNWKMDGSGTVLVTYQTRNDAYAPIFDHQWPIVDVRTPLQPPTRSKNWELDQYQDQWRNRKTGQRIYI